MKRPTCWLASSLGNFGLPFSRFFLVSIGVQVVKPLFKLFFFVATARRRWRSDLFQRSTNSFHFQLTIQWCTSIVEQPLFRVVLRAPAVNRAAKVKVSKSLMQTPELQPMRRRMVAVSRQCAHMTCHDMSKSWCTYPTQSQDVVELP